jgi:hypothetical protein
MGEGVEKQDQFSLIVKVSVVKIYNLFNLFTFPAAPERSENSAPCRFVKILLQCL